MNASGAAAQPNMELLLQISNAYQRTFALKAAIELDLFSAIGKGNRSAATIGQAISSDERGVRILCDSLVIMELLTKKGGEYDLTPTSQTFLDRNSPAYMGSITQFLNL